MITSHRYQAALGTVLHYAILCMLALGGYLIWRTYDLNALDQTSDFNMLSTFGSAVKEFDELLESVAGGNESQPALIQAAFSDIEKGLDFFLMLPQSSMLRQNRQFEEILRDLSLVISDIKLSAANGQIVTDIPALEQKVEQLHLLADAFLLEGLETLSVENIQWRSRSAFLLTFLIILLVIGTGVYLLYVFIMRQQSFAIRTANQISDRANQQLTATINASMDAVIVADMEGIVLECNTASEQIFGYTREEFIGVNLSEIIIPPHLRATHKAGMKRYQELQDPKLVGQGAVSITAIRQDGSEFPVELLRVRGEAESGAPIMISYIRDMTATKTAEAALQQARDAALAADKAKSRFLAIMSHEMRTPLTGIFGALELSEELPADAGSIALGV